MTKIANTMYTQEQLDIALLKNTNEGILETLREIKQEIKSNFHWTLGLILSLYAMGLTAVVGMFGHSKGWF